MARARVNKSGNGRHNKGHNGDRRDKRIGIGESGHIESQVLWCTVRVIATPRLCRALGVTYYFFDSAAAGVSTLAALALVLALFKVD